MGVTICRLVNLLIAHASAEPVLLEPAVTETDHEWVREHVLFRRPSPCNEEETRDVNLGMHRVAPTPLSEMEDNDWFLQTPAGSVFTGNSPQGSFANLNAEGLADYGGWT